MPDILNQIDTRPSTNQPALADRIRPNEKAGTSNSDYKQRLSDSINSRTESQRSTEQGQRTAESRRTVDTENRQTEQSVDSRQSTKDVTTTQKDRSSLRTEQNSSSPKRSEQNSVQQRDDVESNQIEVEQVNEESVEEISQPIVVDAEVVQQQIEPPASIIQLFSELETNDSDERSEGSIQESEFENGPVLPPAGLIDAVALLDNKAIPELSITSEIVDVEVQVESPEIDSVELLDIENGEQQADSGLIEEAESLVDDAIRRENQSIQQRRDETGEQLEIQKNTERLRPEVDKSIQVNTQSVEEKDDGSVTQSSSSEENNALNIQSENVSKDQPASLANEAPTFTPKKVSLQDHRTQAVDKSDSTGEQQSGVTRENNSIVEVSNQQAPIANTATAGLSESRATGDKSISTEAAPGKVSLDNASLSLDSGQRAASVENTKAASKAAKLSVDASEIVERAAQAIRSASQSDKQMRVRLSPPELGVMNVKVSVEAGVISATLEVETPAAQKALLENMSMLRESLSQVGVGVERIDVQLSDQSLDDQTRDSQYSEEQNQDQQQDHSDQEEKESKDEQQSGESSRASELQQSNDTGTSQARSSSSSSRSGSSVIDELDIAV